MIRILYECVAVKKSPPCGKLLCKPCLLATSAATSAHSLCPHGELCHTTPGMQDGMGDTASGRNREYNGMLGTTDHEGSSPHHCGESGPLSWGTMSSIKDKKLSTIMRKQCPPSWGNNVPQQGEIPNIIIYHKLI